VKHITEDMISQKIKDMPPDNFRIIDSGENDTLYNDFKSIIKLFVIIHESSRLSEVLRIVSEGDISNLQREFSRILMLEEDPLMVNDHISLD
jgi:hypothetical protein